MRLLASINLKAIQLAIRKNIPLFVAFTSTYLLFFVVLLQTLSYVRLNVFVYSFVFIFLFMIILILSLVAFEGVYEKKKKLRSTALIGFVILGLVFSLLTYYLVRINSSINNVIVDSNETILEQAFVTYQNTSIKDINDMNNVRLGILSNSETSDRNSHVKAVIEDESLNIQYVEYLSYSELLLGLFAEDIDVATLPKDYMNQFEGYEGYESYLEDTAIVHEFKTTITSDAQVSEIDVSKEPFTILIMGNDGGRTDSLILASYNPISLQVTMTSIPRDSYVPIACYPNQAKDKIGHAFTVSKDCAIETVENLMDVDISYYVVVNFTGVVEIVDALDKVWLESPIQFVGQDSSEERGHYTVWIPKGGFWATGEQALAFARERKLMPGGDFQRQENQQQVIDSIITKTLELRDVNKALNVLEAAGNNIETNMSLNDMITIFNTLTKAISRTNVSEAYIVDIIGSQVMGYSSMTYNEPLELPLYIVIPYQGSIADNKALLDGNLMVDTTLPEQVKMNFDANSVFFSIDYFAKTYNEVEVHEKLPDIVPHIANNDWTLSEVLTWAQSRNISIVQDKIEDGEAGYVSSVEHNYIVSQSVRYGIKTSKVSSLTVGVIKHDLDCKIEANMVYDECRYRLPDFVLEKTKLTDVVTWAKTNNITLKYVLIPETDPSYDKTKIGYVIKQSPETIEDIRNLSELTLTIMDPNFSVTIPVTTAWTLTTAKEWVAANLSDPSYYTVTYVPTTDQSKVGFVSSTTPVSGTKIKVNQTLSISVFAEGLVLDNYVGRTKTDVQSSLCTPGIVQCVFLDKLTTDATLVDKVETQSIPSGTLKLKTEWATTSLTFTIYKLQSSTTSTTPSTTTP